MNTWNGILKLRTCIPYLIEKTRRIHQFDFIRRIKYPERETFNTNLKKNINLNPSSVVNSSRPIHKHGKDYYAILGVNKDANFNEIKNAYYILAKKFHPDSHQKVASADAKKFQEISEAYDVLGDDNKRMEYDLHGTVKSVGSYVRILTSQNSQRGVFNTNDNREQYFIKRKLPAKEDVSLTITFAQAVKGTRKEVLVKIPALCTTCNGLLSKQQRLEICKLCNGTGKNIEATRSSVLTNTCKACKGARYISRQECIDCSNTGYTSVQKRVMVNVPSGANCGDVLKVQHPNGIDIVHVKIKIATNKQFQRIGNDVYSEKYIKISEAIRGGVVKIKGIYEDFDVKLFEGTESHTKMRIPGKGVKTAEGVGDHIVLFKIRIPKYLSYREKEMLDILVKLEESSSTSTNRIMFNS